MAQIPWLLVGKAVELMPPRIWQRLGETLQCHDQSHEVGGSLLTTAPSNPGVTGYRAAQHRHNIRDNLVCPGPGWWPAHLHQYSPAESCLHQGLGHPAGSICSRAVHFGVVLPREGTTTMRPPAAIRVHDDLSACDARIPLWRGRKQWQVKTRDPPVAASKHPT